jgi:N-acetylglucosamine-6-phosphate deacetylase
LIAKELFDGRTETVQENCLIELADGHISGLRPATEGERQGTDIPRYDIVAPGFIDLQINGAADAQFNFAPDPDTLATMARGARQGGTAHIMPTFITAPNRDYRHAMDAVRRAIAAGSPGILGLHLEGPFLSPLRPGIHTPDAIRAPDPDDLHALDSADIGGPLLLTVAPECLPDGSLARLSDAGVIVFAGHSAATADQIAAAQNHGLRGATHLFNAMSQITGRDPGVVGAVLTSRGLFAGIIADGHHVDWRNIALAAAMMPDHLCLVTDAMLTLAGSRDGFDLDGRAITLKDGRLTDAGGRLAGAHIDMASCVRNLIARCGVSRAAALAMASGHPARALGLGDRLGAVAPGYRASLTCLSEDLKPQAVVVDGQRFQT